MAFAYSNLTSGAHTIEAVARTADGQEARSAATFEVVKFAQDFISDPQAVNLDAADVLIPGEDPRAITSLIRIAKRTRAVVQFNILISILVTVILMGAVLTGMNSLALAVLVHEMSAFLVILNGAFIATSGNRLNLLKSVLGSILKDYSDAVKLLFSKESASIAHD